MPQEHLSHFCLSLMHFSPPPLRFSGYFFDCPIFTIPGRTYPVEILYTKVGGWLCPAAGLYRTALVHPATYWLVEPQHVLERLPPAANHSLFPCLLECYPLIIVCASRCLMRRLENKGSGVPLTAPCTDLVYL
jgi:hypothetical protein